jgi:hypothetical protein
VGIRAPAPSWVILLLRIVRTSAVGTDGSATICSRIRARVAALVQ